MLTNSQLTIEQAYAILTNEEKSTELSKGVTVETIYTFIQNGQRTKISEFVYNRFYQRYLRPFAKVSKKFNNGFAQMASCCLMIETIESFRHGWNDTMRDAKKSNRKRKYGGEIFEDFFNRYNEFQDFHNFGNKFYSNVRCGILHQAETKDGWRIRRNGKLFNEPKQTINSTLFRRMMKRCLKEYCIELMKTDEKSNLWIEFKNKMAYVMMNCHKNK